MPPSASAFACGSASATPPQGGSDCWGLHTTLDYHSPLEGESVRQGLRPQSNRWGGRNRRDRHIGDSARSRAGGGPTRRLVSECRRCDGSIVLERLVNGHQKLQGFGHREWQCRPPPLLLGTAGTVCHNRLSGSSSSACRNSPVGMTGAPDCGRPPEPVVPWY